MTRPYEPPRRYDPWEPYAGYRIRRAAKSVMRARRPFHRVWLSRYAIDATIRTSPMRQFRRRAGFRFPAVMRPMR